jgi:hypothetical protein
MPLLANSGLEDRRMRSPFFFQLKEKRRPWPDYYPCTSWRTMTSQDLPA